jgi:hypothetical protein
MGALSKQLHPNTIIADQEQRKEKRHTFAKSLIKGENIEDIPAFDPDKVPLDAFICVYGKRRFVRTFITTSNRF